MYFATSLMHLAHLRYKELIIITAISSEIGAQDLESSCRTKIRNVDNYFTEHVAFTGFTVEETSKYLFLIKRNATLDTIKELIQCPGTNPLLLSWKCNENDC